MDNIEGGELFCGRESIERVSRTVALPEGRLLLRQKPVASTPLVVSFSTRATRYLSKNEKSGMKKANEEAPLLFGSSLYTHTSKHTS